MKAASEKQPIPVIHGAHPALEQDDGRCAPFRGLVAPVMLPPVGPVTVEIDIADALMCGLSIQTLVKTGYVRDPATAAVYEKVGGQLVEAARAAAARIK